MQCTQGDIDSLVATDELGVIKLGGIREADCEQVFYFMPPNKLGQQAGGIGDLVIVSGYAKDFGTLTVGEEEWVIAASAETVVYLR